MALRCREERKRIMGRRVAAAEHGARPLRNVQLGLMSVLWARVQEVMAANCHT